MGRLRALLARLRPPSLAARTSLLLICGLGVIQAGGLAIHALDRLDFDRRMLEEQYHTEVITLYRGIVETAMDHRDTELASLHMPPSFHAELTPGPEPDMIDGLMLSQHGERRMARMDSPWGGAPPEQAPGGGPAPPPGGAMEEGDDRHGGAPASRWRGHGGEGGGGGPQAFGGGRSPWGGPPWGMG
ncbi:histidine kinase, partial [Novacetimonas hansenii]|nr:histidine kinase [Novacetimonas hansenii]